MVSALIYYSTRIPLFLFTGGSREIRTLMPLGRQILSLLADPKSAGSIQFPHTPIKP